MNYPAASGRGICLKMLNTYAASGGVLDPLSNKSRTSRLFVPPKKVFLRAICVNPCTKNIFFMLLRVTSWIQKGLKNDNPHLPKTC